MSAHQRLSPLDGVAFVVGPALLLVVTAVACLIVARRVTSIDPREALVAE